MKKNQLLLFALYFFVVQPLVASIIWSDMGFLWLALVNVVAVILISILYTYFVERVVAEDHEYHQKHTKRQHAFGGLFFLVIISILLAILGIFLLQDYILALRLFLGGLVGFMIYFIGYFLSGLRHNFKFFKLLFTHIYLVLVVVSGVFLGMFVYQNSLSTSLNDMYKSVLLSSESPTTQATGDVVIVSGFTDSSIIEQTGTVLDVSAPDEEEDTAPTADFPITPLVQKEILSKDAKEKITIMDAIIYLIDTRSIPLSQKTIGFTYVSSKNTYYPYYVTAYEKKMIGKTTHPSKNILCETYIVMKGLVEGWDVPTSSTIKQSYWDEATTRGVLNNCTYGTYVKVENL